MIPDIVSWLGRFTRVVAVDVPHHVTQRGNGRRFVLISHLRDRNNPHQKPRSRTEQIPSYWPNYATFNYAPNENIP
jgi:hypothetical protein